MDKPAVANANPQIQQILTNVTAQLSPLAKNPPELNEYSRVHGQHFGTVLRPTGFKYFVLNGASLGRVIAFNPGSLDTDLPPTQEASFRRASYKVIQDLAPMVLAAQTPPTNTNAALEVETAVNGESIPLFNQTKYQVFFVPISIEKQAFGVIQVWFDPRDSEATRARQQIATHFAEEMALYFRSRRASDLHRESVRLGTYVQLLESLGGDLDLEAVAWNIVNYARESVDCERVSIFSVRDFPKQDPDDLSFVLLATSGLKKPNPRSEQAVVLNELVGELARTILMASSPTPAPAGAPAAGESSNGTSGSADAPKENRPPADLPATPMTASGQPQFRLTFTMRDPDKVATRPDAINDYFEAVPMNWATTLPLFDRDSHVCGVLLFEGQRDPDKVRTSFLQMRDLAYSGGRSLGTALVWHNRRTLRWAHAVFEWRNRYFRRQGRRNLLRIGLPVLGVLLAMLYPARFTVSGTATLEPVHFVTVSAEVSGRIEQIQAQLGEEIQKDALLLQLDQRDLLLQLQQAEQEYQRFRVQADTAIAFSEENQVQVARLNAARAALNRDKIKADLLRTQIHAPIGGIVIGPQNLATRTGEFIRVGEGLVTMADPTSWRVRIQLREQDQPFLAQALRRSGQLEAAIKFNAEPTTTYQAMLTHDDQISKGLDLGGGKYGFGAALPFTPSTNLAQQFRTGFSGRASFEIGRRPLAYVFFRDFIHFLRMQF